MKPIFLKALPTFALLALAPSLPSFACDFCVCPTPDIFEFTTDKPVSFYANVAEQFTRYATVREDGSTVDNPTGQYMNSSISHAVVGVALFENRFALQLNVPVIARQYKRPVGYDIQYGTVAGFGDLSLMAGWTIFRTKGAAGPAEGGSEKNAKAVTMTHGSDFDAAVTLLAGLKFPTGSSSRLQEEFNEVEVPGAPPSGIHGHDLALGSGSWDGIFGVESFMRYKKLFLQAEMQYAARNEGSYSYRYANQISWSGGPGVYLIRESGRAVALQAVIAGESKGLDTFQGEAAEDTGLTSLYLGPRVLATFGSWTMDVVCDLPVVMNNTALQTTPNFRIRAGVTYNF
jgi:hypothetical protein